MRQARTADILAPQAKGLGPAFLWTIVRFAYRKPLGASGAGIVLLLIVIAALAPLIAPYNPYQMNFAAPFSPPNQEFIFGTDKFGRDVFSRVLWGGRISLYVGIVSVALGCTAGSILGMLSGYLGGKFDLGVQRVVDILLGFPLLVLALMIVAALGFSVTNVIWSIAVVLVPQSARILRSAALSVKETQYVDAAVAIGASRAHIVLAHMLPNCVAPYIIVASLSVGFAIIVEASLSFVGLGIPPPEPAWGSMLSGAAREYAERAPWLPIFPGVVISLAVFGFNLLGDGLRDALDPRLRGF